MRYISSDIFVSLFSEPLGGENKNKNIRTRKIYPFWTILDSRLSQRFRAKRVPKA